MLDQLLIIASQKQIGIPVASMCFPSSQRLMYTSGAQADDPLYGAPSKLECT